MAKDYNMTIYQGADWYLDIEYKDSANNPISLTGYTAKMQFREYTNSTEAPVTLQSGSGITITAAEGKLSIHATAAQTTLLVAREYVYDLKIISSTGIVTRLIQGVAAIDDQVTRV